MPPITPITPERKEALYRHSLAVVACVGVAVLASTLIRHWYLVREKGFQPDYQTFEAVYGQVTSGMTDNEVTALLGTPGTKSRENKILPRGTVWRWTYQVHSRCYIVLFHADDLLEETPKWRVYNQSTDNPFDAQNLRISGFQWIGGLSALFYGLYLAGRYLLRRRLSAS